VQKPLQSIQCITATENINSTKEYTTYSTILLSPFLWQVNETTSLHYVSWLSSAGVMQSLQAGYNLYIHRTCQYNLWMLTALGHSHMTRLKKILDTAYGWKIAY